MKVFVRISRFAEDIVNKLRACKWKAVLCAVLSVVGLVLGIVLFRLANYNWWYTNRCDYAQTLVYGNFGAAISFVIQYAVLFTITLICNMYPPVRFLLYVEYFVFMLYCGANIAALIVCFGILGVLYTILVAIAEVVAVYLIFFLCACECACRRTFKEAFCDMKYALYMFICLLIAKIICIFVVLRLITAFI